MLSMNACSEKSKNPDPVPEPARFTIKAADLSFLPELEEAGVVFHNRSGVAEAMLKTLKDEGLNTVRIRLWKDPAGVHSGFAEVKAFAATVRASGLKVWLSVHYSDTWADPGAQTTPAAWQGIGFNALKDSVYNYTARIVRQIKPDYIQIGNEVNNGMLWPLGSANNHTGFSQLLQAGSRAVRENDSACRIIIHYAGFTDAADFFAGIQDVDFDIIGLSYYPVWHGKDLNLLETALNDLGTQFNKQVLIAETAYPFTLGWNDWTNNVIGLQDQLLTAYPATPQGQHDFLKEIRRISTADSTSIGFAYWGGEWVAFKGPQATNGSSWENQAFYDFDLNALPVIEVYN